ncbi:MAG: class II aldolase/adducin family protein, partial [Bacillota bacterium]|nr:class II aldolase/adducin family protein [Bacillota bacterium]
MDEQNPKELIIRAGKELLISGLVSRTWGNVSCRTGDNTFAVTPSGRSYETLSPGEIVICRTEDCAYEGEIKPSSEKGIHALLYRTRPDVNFIIHTHQSMASAVSVLETKSIPSSGFSELGENVPIADYGLPGSGKLRENVGKAIERCGGHAVIMA